MVAKAEATSESRFRRRFLRSGPRNFRADTTHRAALPPHARCKMRDAECWRSPAGGKRQYYLDQEIALYLLGSGNNGRYYDAAAGRFLSEDPTKQGGTSKNSNSQFLTPNSSADDNLYRYTGNDPINNLDPSGHDTKRTYNPPQTQPAQGPNANVHSKVPATGHGTAVHGGTGTTGGHGRSDTPPDGSKPPQGAALHGTAGGGTASGQHGIANTSTGPTIEANPQRSWLGQKVDSFKIWWKYGHGGFFDQHPILSHLKDNVIKPVMHGIGEDVGGLVHAFAHPIDTATGIFHGVKSVVTHPVAAVGAAKAAYRHFSQLPGDKKIQAVVQQTTAALAPVGAAKVLGKLGDVAKALGLGRAGEKIPELGNKLEYLLGKATGADHNIQRSKDMLGQLERIGLSNTPSARKYLTEHLTQILNDPTNIVATERSGRVVRESLLLGPRGGVKLETIWDGSKLITAKINGAR